MVVSDVSGSLPERLRDRIRREGPITFAQFMEAALYDPDEGFYARPPIGVSLHYVTSPHLSPAFAALLADQLEECRRMIGQGFAVVEAGAGDGTLAAQLLRHPALSGVRYVAVERSPGAREALAARGLESAGSLAEIAAVEGVLLANEVLDNVPFHRIRMRGGRLVEVMVGLAGEQFAELEAVPSDEAVQALGRPPAEGEERPASPGWRAWVREAAEVLRRGWVFVVDYGFSGDEPAQSVRGYARQRVLDDVLSGPGTRDISTGVDFDVLAAEAREAGLEVWGPVSQRDFLMATGFRSWMERLRSRQAEAETAGRHREALRLFAERSRAPMLVDEAHLGSLRVLVLGRGVAGPGALRR